METISAREIDRYIFDRNYLLVDVRQPADYRRMHVRGAVCIPYETLKARIRGLGSTIPILYCERGGLSMQAARELEERGISGTVCCRRNQSLPRKISWRATNPEKGLTGFHGTDKIEEK
ncbi:MAG: rhodanese-like domain-containing protein [Lachnospiraceae bacterium]